MGNPSRLAGAALIVTLGVVAQGCATVGIPRPLSRGAVPTAPGVETTVAGSAYRTFNAPVDRMRLATLATFKRMKMTVKTDDATDDGRELVAVGADHTIYVQLERLTARTTRMRITAKSGWLWRDRAPAGEMLAQTERTLADPAAMQRNK
jgi:hypothetical protein